MHSLKFNFKMKIMQKKELSLQVINSRAAGIDVGSRFHMVAIDQNKENVKQFGVYTCDHEKLIDYLRENEITTIAMESTGTYWQPLFNALQSSGFEVLLVGGNQTKNVKGRKTDVLDCMWIQKLHSLGLLSGSFLLTDVIGSLRTYYYHRQHLVEQSAMYVNKMQKALRLMNIRLDVVIRDVTGKSGLNIIEAILAGQRDAHYLASLVDIRVKRSAAEIAEGLHGWWREELLFELKNCLEFYKLYEKAMADCDKEIEKKLREYIPDIPANIVEVRTPNGRLKKRSKNAPSFDVVGLGYQYFKTDITAISGISYSTVLCLLTNIGNDLHRFHSAKSFASWLRLVPNNKVSGGKLISNKTPVGKNYLATALRQAANSIGNQKDHELSAFFKRIAFKKGRVAAITATARKLAVIIWNMITRSEPYRKMEVQVNNVKYKAIQMRNIERRIGSLKLNTEELQKLFSRTSLLTN
jgi:transposase